LTIDILPKSFNFHITHQKSNRQTLFLYSEKQNNLQKVRKFAEVRNFA